eukprot:m51a1_g1932 hypothetical protein (640) ;mRNA; r:910675-913299
MHEARVFTRAVYSLAQTSVSFRDALCCEDFIRAFISNFAVYSAHTNVIEGLLAMCEPKRRFLVLLAPVAHWDENFAFQEDTQPPTTPPKAIQGHITLQWRKTFVSRWNRWAGEVALGHLSEAAHMRLVLIQDLGTMRAALCAVQSQRQTAEGRGQGTLALLRQCIGVPLDSSVSADELSYWMITGLGRNASDLRELQRHPGRTALRWAVAGIGPLPGVPEGILERLRTIRTEYQRLTAELDARLGMGHESSGDELVLALFAQVWHALQPLHERHALGLPPLRRDAALDRTLLSLIRLCRARETHPDGVLDRSHAVVGGLEGAGKTTIARALAVAVATSRGAAGSPAGPTSCSPARTLDFDSDLVFETGPTMDADYSLSALAEAPEWHCRVGLIVDELGEAVVAGVPPDDPRAEAFRDIRAFAMAQPGALLVATGSSAGLRSQLWGPRGAVEWVQYSSYPLWERSLCQYLHVAAFPLRDPAQLREYVAQRYGAHLTAAETAELLHRTGGIARAVDAAMTAAGVQNSQGRAAELRAAVMNARDPFFLFPQIVRQRTARVPELESAITAWSAGRTAFLEPSVLRVPIGLLRRDMQALGHGDCTNWVSRWADRGLVHVVHDSAGTTTDVEVARPIDAETLFVH